MHKNKYPIVFTCVIFLLCLSALRAMGEDYIKNIEAGETNIKIDQAELPRIAYLYIELKNNGPRRIANLTFEVSYYDHEGYLIEKSVVKNALTEAIPKGQTRKYKIRLKGDVINTEHEEYPYSQLGKVNEFDIKITNVKTDSK